MAGITVRSRIAQPLPREALSPGFDGWRKMPLRFARRRLLSPARTIELYRAWRERSLELNPFSERKILLETSVRDRDEEYFYCYPINLDYLFKKEWRSNNLHSPLGFFRWAVEMDAALSIGLVRGYEGSRMGQSVLGRCIKAVKRIEGAKCGYMHINSSLATIAATITFLAHLEREGRIDSFAGNQSQIALADLIGIDHLGELYQLLSAIPSGRGESWAQALGYNKIDLPVFRVRGFFGEMAGFYERTGYPLSRLCKELRKLPPEAARSKFLELKERVELGFQRFL